MTAGDPWRVRARRTVLDERWLKVRAESCVLPSGGVLDPYFILDYPDWVNTVALTDDGCIVLVRGWRHAIGAVVTEPPGGAVDPADPSLAAAARREFEEETGWRAEGFRPVCGLPANPATHSNRIHTFLAEHARPHGPPKHEVGEDLAVLAMPIAKVVAGLADGLIGQAMHVGPLLLALRLAGRLSMEVT